MKACQPLKTHSLDSKWFQSTPATPPSPSLLSHFLFHSSMIPIYSSIFKLSRGTVSQSSILESDCSDEPAEPSSLSKHPYGQLEMRTSRRGLGVVGLLATFSVFVITGGTSTLILAWLWAFHDPVEGGGSVLAALRNGSFAIREPSGPGESFLFQTHSETLRILMFSALAVSLRPFAVLLLN